MKEEMINKIINDKKNIIVEGGVSSGKTTNIFYPIINNLIAKKENLFILDSNIEYINYYEKLKENGYNVRIINLRNIEYTEGWNLLEYPCALDKTDNTDSALNLVEKIAKTIFKDDIESINIFIGLVFAIYEEQYINMLEMDKVKLNNVVALIDSAYIEYGISDCFDEYFKEKDHKAISYMYLLPILSLSKEERNKKLSIVRNKLVPYISRDKLSKFMSKTTFRIKDINTKPVAIIFISNTEDKVFNLLTTIFIEQLYTILSRVDTSEYKSFSFILDNFDTLDDFDNLIDILNTDITKIIKFYIGTRSVDRLVNKYSNYIFKLCDLVLIKEVSIKLISNEREEDFPKNFDKTEIINKSNIDFPKLNNIEIQTIDIAKRVDDIKRNKYKQIDTNIEINSKDSIKSIDKMISDIDKKIAELERLDKDDSNE